MDGGGRPRGRPRGSARRARADRRYVPVGRDARAGGRRLAARTGRRRPAGDSRPRARQSRRGASHRWGPSRLHSAAGGRRLVRRGAGARHAWGRGAGPRPAVARAHPGAPRLLLRFRARSVPDRQPSGTGARVRRRLRAHAPIRGGRVTLRGGESSALPRRRAGLLIPLFSLKSARGWGIGEIGDIAGAAAWLESAGLSLLQLLPINELPLHETSPYSSLSAMAIDPQYLTMADVEDFAAIGGERGLEAELRANLERLRIEPTVNYAGVRRLKHLALRRSYERFRDTELQTGSERARAFAAFTKDQAWWLADYALFRALHERMRPLPWTEWPEGLRTHHPVALADARAELADDVCYREYLQWLASDQWHAARDAAGAVTLFGDLPFMVRSEERRVGKECRCRWSREHE